MLAQAHASSWMKQIRARAELSTSMQARPTILDELETTSSIQAPPPLNKLGRAQHENPPPLLRRRARLYKLGTIACTYVKCKCKSHLLGAFVTIATLRSPVLTARKHTCGSLRLRLHKPHVANRPISRPHDLHSQSSVAVTHLHTGCCSFYLPRRAGILSRDCLLRGLNPGPPAHMNEHASERPTT